MARLFTIYGNGHVKTGFDVPNVEVTTAKPELKIGDCATTARLSQSLMTQIEKCSRGPVCDCRASLRMSNGGIELSPEPTENGPASNQALVLLDPRCWWHSQTKLNSGITKIYYHVDPKNIILEGIERFGSEGMTLCQTMLVRVDIGDEIMIGWTKYEGQGPTLKVSKETRTLIYTGETFEDVSVPVLYWRREVK